jgi:hypothetical protein
VIDGNIGNIPQTTLVAWSSSSNYVVGNVRYDAVDDNSYTCIADISGSPWSNTTSYALNALVGRDGQNWRSQIAGNVGNTPQELLVAWAPSSNYVAGNVRYHTYNDGGDEVTNSFRCIVDISGSSTPPSNDTDNWEEFGTGSGASDVWAVVEPPSTDTTNWASFGTGSDASGVWSSVSPPTPLNPDTLYPNDDFVTDVFGITSVPTSANTDSLSGKPPGVDVTPVTTRQLLLNFLNSYFQYVHIDEGIPRITATLETHLTYGTPNVLTLRISSPLTVESAGIYFGYNSRGPYTFGIIPPHTGPLNDAPIAPYYGLMISRGSTVVQATYPIVCD